jgi:hypothetical protein
MTPNPLQYLACAVLRAQQNYTSEALPASFQTSHMAHLRQPAVYGAARLADFTVITEKIAG